MKKIYLVLILAIFGYADAFRISDFEADVYSKVSQNSTKKIRVSLEILGDSVSENEAYVLDALNVIIGSFYAEDLLTSVGKEKFKQAFIKYAVKKHSVNLDEVLIISLKVVEKPEIDEIINAIRAKNLCTISDSHKETNSKKSNDIVISPELKDINQRPIDLNSIGEFGKDFGE
ncbi:hypothetical protein [Campylobacter mucosalis]|uniref:hypothetical protein n=1 Tax=Campylobacter mucosalis TaxID=202 RepID=UPI001470742B|nr:hypothetical protein [Campylobacter mucosalis]